MSGFIVQVSSNARGWYLAGTLLFFAGGLALTIAGFAAIGVSWGITGIVVMLVSALFVIDAIMNMR